MSNQAALWDMADLRTVLRGKRVAIIGLGALGSVVALHLTRLGLGELSLIDRDIVDWSNLTRQVLYTEQDAMESLPKVIAAKRRLKATGSEVKITAHLENVTPLNVVQLVKGHDLIVDGTDNMQIRFLINDVSVKLNIPWIYGGVIAARGVVAAFVPGRTPCLRCLLPQPDEGHGQTCDTVGVVGPLVHIIGSYQSILACQLLTGREVDLSTLTHIEVWNQDFDGLPRRLNPSCPCCQKKEFHFLQSMEMEPLITELCGRNSVQITPLQSASIPFEEWVERWRRLGEVSRTPYYVQLLYATYRILLFNDGRLLVEGLDSPEEAQSLYHKLVGG